MKREFTQREKVLLLFLTLVLLFTGYVKLFSEPLTEQMTAEQNRLAEQQDAQLAEQLRLSQKRAMEAVLESQGAAEAPRGKIPEYDNIENVMIQLDGILSAASDYELTFDELQYGENLISRPIRMSFTTGSYAAARAILDDLYGGFYRCTLSDISVSAETDVTMQPVSVSLLVTFYEHSIMTEPEPVT